MEASLSFGKFKVYRKPLCYKHLHALAQVWQAKVGAYE